MLEKILKTRFMFLFEEMNIEEYKFICAEEKGKKSLEIEKLEKARKRREKRRCKLREMAEELKYEIQKYLLKASLPRNEFEKILLRKMKKELGTITSAKELSAFLKMSKTTVYDAIAAGEILTITRGRRKFIVTEGLLPFLR